MTDTASTSAGAPQVDGVPIEINGVEVIANKGELVIDAAERNGVYIPRFCYHPRMNPVGMCRMCIVEVDTGRGPALQPTCMLEATPGMKLNTESEVTKKAQEGARDHDRREHREHDPDGEQHGEAPDRSAGERKQDERSNEGRYVTVQDRPDAFVVAGLERAPRRLAAPDLLFDALEDDDIGIGCDPDGEHDAGDA